MGQPIDKITLKGFKSIRDLEDFPLRNLNILIGANGAGKSNFVDFFRLLRAMVDERLQKFVREQGGGDGFFFMGPKETLRISARLQFAEYIYEFELAPTSFGDLMVGNEHTRLTGRAESLGEKWDRESDLKRRHEGKREAR